MENEKAEYKRQWQERSERPIATRPMSREQIEEFRRYLVMSYKCDQEDITFDFEKIFDENDEDRDDCLWLKYKMNTIWGGKPTLRVIYTIKLPIPEELRMMAEQKKRQSKGMQRTRRTPGSQLALPAPPPNSPVSPALPQPPPAPLIVEEITNQIETSPAIVEPQQQTDTIIQTVRPKLRKPVRKTTKV